MLQSSAIDVLAQSSATVSVYHTMAELWVKTSTAELWSMMISNSPRSEQSWWLTQLSLLLCCPVNGTQRSAREIFWLKHRWSAMMADVITKNNNGRYKEEKKRNRRVSDPRVSTINGNQINGHVLVSLKRRRLYFFMREYPQGKIGLSYSPLGP